MKRRTIKIPTKYGRITLAMALKAWRRIASKGEVKT